MDYKKILEGVVDIINTTEKSDIGFSNICSYISKNCPELKESEDERIMKSIIGFLKTIASLKNGRTVSNEDFDSKELLNWTTWLEKQGEQKTYNKIVEEEKPLLEKFKQAVYDCAWGKVTCKKEGETKEEYANRWAEQFLLIVRDWADDYIEFTIEQKLRNAYEKGKMDIIKKQNEQETTDKVEPKFNVGDWITFNGGEPFKIIKIETKINGLNYLLLKQNGYNSFYDNKYVNENARLWTIQDVKAGDVLAADPIKGIEGFSSSFIAIYKKRNGEDFDSYCFVGFNGKFDKNGIEHSTDNIHPATKEQRDFLFQKMEEAGYDWDAEEMKLEEIKYNKRQWKNHDEEMINGISNFIGYNQDLVEGGVDEWLDWLKNLEKQIKKLREE